MAYKKLGYTTVQEGQYIPSSAQELATHMGNGLEAEISAAVKEMGSDRQYLEGLSLPDLLRMRSPKLDPGSAMHKQFLTLVIKILVKAGYLQTDVDRVTYVNQPQCSVEEAVGNMLTSKIPWLQKQDFGGEKATLNSLKSLLPVAVREFATIGRLRKDYYTWLRMSLSDIGYKLVNGQPIDQSEKSFFLSYCNTEKGSPGAALGMNTDGKPMPIPASPIDSTVAKEAFALYKQSVQPGPGMMYYKMVSNQNLEALVFYYGPHAPSLPLSIGYRYTFGPYKQLKLTRFDEKTWTDKDIIAGIRDRFVDLPTSVSDATKEQMANAKAAGEAIMARRLTTEQISWVMTSPVKVCGPESLECAPAFMDFPDVRLRLKDETDIARFTYEYYSTWRQRNVMSIAGGNPDMMYLDMAIRHATQGSGIMDKLNLDDYNLVDLDESVEDRQIGRVNNEITESIMFVKGSTGLQTANINMTDFYRKRGTIMYRPAFAEYFLPPRGWYFIEDQQANEFIAASLGLSRDDAVRNNLAITLSHNNEVFKRLTLADAPFDVITLIKTILNVR
jgi:hypothetical protein